jgi:hypothetical protein
MMSLQRGNNLVLGVTVANMQELNDGVVIHVLGDRVGLPGVNIYLVLGETHEQMRRDLRASGYDIDVDPHPRGNGGDREGEGGN